MRYCLPDQYHRLVACRAAPTQSALRLAAGLWPLLEALRALDVGFDLFSAYDQAFQVVPADGEGTLARLLEQGEIEWPEPLPAGVPTHATRLFNRLEGPQFADLYVAWIREGAPGSPSLWVELRVGHDPGARQAPLLRQAFGAMVRALAPDIAFGETCFQEPRAPQRELVPRAGWITFVPERLGPPPALEAPTEMDALPGLGAIVIATPNALDDSDTCAAVRDRVAAALDPVLRGIPGAHAAPPPQPARPAAARVAVPSYLQQPEKSPPQPLPPRPASVAPPRIVEAPPSAPAPLDLGPEGTPAPALSIGAVRCAAVAWRMQGALYLTTLVKASFAVQLDGTLSPTDPAPVSLEDRYQASSPLCLEDPTDRVPYLPQTDVILTGHAEVPEGGQAVVRVALEKRNPERPGPEVLMDKRARVRGDLDASTGGLVRVPLRYEHAFGGAGYGMNPVGVGHAPGDPAPRVVHPDDPRAVACFGPISPYWEARARLLGPKDRDKLRQPIPELPAGFPWAWFSAAPSDQRIPGFLRGDEVLVLEGLHPARPRVEVRLPGLSARCLVWAPDAPPEIPRMALDTLRIDPDRGVLTLTWRGYLAVPDERALRDRVVAGALSRPGEAVHWPTPAVIEEARQRFRQRKPVAPPAAAAIPLNMTTDASHAPPSRPLPFPAQGPSSNAPAAAPSSSPPPWREARRAPVPAGAQQHATIAMPAIPPGEGEAGGADPRDPKDPSGGSERP